MMSSAMLKTVKSGLLPEADIEAARDASRALARLGSRGGVHVQAEEGGERQDFVLPATAVRLLTDMLALLAQGRSVVVMPEDAELTTQQAADMLNVSRPYWSGCWRMEPYRTTRLARIAGSACATSWPIGHNAQQTPRQLWMS